MPIWGPLSLSCAGGWSTSTLPWLPIGLLYPLSCPCRPGCGRGPIQPRSSGTPETTQEVRHGGPQDEGLKRSGRWLGYWWALTCHFGVSLKHWDPAPGGMQRVALPTQSELAPLCLQVGSFCRAFWGSGTPVAGLGGGSEDHGRGQPPADNTGQGAAPRGDTALPAGMWGGTGWGTPCPLVTGPPGTKPLQFPCVPS